MVLVYPLTPSDGSVELVCFLALLSLPTAPLAFSPCVSERVGARRWWWGRPQGVEVVFLVVVLRADVMDEVRIVKRPRAQRTFA